MYRTLQLLSKFKPPCINIELFNPINDFSSKNIQYFTSLNIKILNPKNVSPHTIFSTHIFQARIDFEKDNLSVSKEFKNNDFKNLLEDINNFVNEEIKI